MSHRHERLIHWDLWMQTWENMDIETQELGADVAVSAMLASFVFYAGANPTFIAGCITLVHSVHIPRAIRAYREAKHDFPLPTNESE